MAEEAQTVGIIIIIIIVIIVGILRTARVTARFPSPWAACTSPCRAWVGGYRRVTQRGFHREIPAGQRRQLSRHPTACQAQWQAWHGPNCGVTPAGRPRCLENGGHPRAQRRSGASTLCTCATLLRARKAPLAPLHYFKQTTRKDPSDSLRSGARTHARNGCSRTLRRDKRRFSRGRSRNGRSREAERRTESIPNSRQRRAAPRPRAPAIGKAVSGQTAARLAHRASIGPRARRCQLAS